MTVEPQLHQRHRITGMEGASSDVKESRLVPAGFESISLEVARPLR